MLWVGRWCIFLCRSTLAAGRCWNPTGETPALRFGLHELSQSFCGLIAIQARGGYVQNQLLPCFAVGRRFDSIQSKEDDGRYHGSSFVAVAEWVITTDVEEISGGNF